MIAGLTMLRMSTAAKFAQLPSEIAYTLSVANTGTV